MRRAGIGDRQRELLGEVIGERGLGRDEGFEIVVAVLAPGRCRRRPIRNSPARPRHWSGTPPRRHRRAAHRRGRRRPVRSGMARRHRRRVSHQSPSDASVSADGLAGRPIWRRPRRPRCARAADCARVPLPRRSTRSRLRELQQLDGLHQLRRHDERVALPDFESLSKRHRSSRLKLVQFLLIRFLGRCILLL